MYASCRYLLCALAILLLLPAAGKGQQYELSAEHFHVRRLDTLVQFPFLGGLNSPAIQWCDLNADGYQDLFVFDSGEFFSFLTDHSPALHFRNIFHDTTPVQDWFLLSDLNGDGRPDLFCGDGKSHVVFYRNTGDSARWFDLASPQDVRTVDNTSVLSESISYPALGDLDGDGDLDFLTGNSAPGTISLYRNIGTQQEARWKFETESFGGIAVLPDTIIVKQGIAKQGIVKKGGRERILHGASSVTLFDIDRDGLPDLFFGDYYTSTILYFKNTGPLLTPKFTFASRLFPIEDPTVTIGFNRAIFTNDSIPDLFVTVGLPTAETDNFYHYKNIGSPDKPSYMRQTMNYLSTLDAGRKSHVCWTDFNHDGKEDFILGSEKGTIQAYQRDTDTTFHWVSDNWGGLPALPGSAPFLTDLNNDSLPDCVIGQFDGTLRAYQNIGLPDFPLFSDNHSFVPVDDFGSYVVPAFADMDGDGDADMVLGNSAGALLLFENVGTISTPAFTLHSTGLDSVQIGLFLSPLLADWNSDGRPDIIVGNAEGVVSVFYAKGAWSFSSFPDLVLKTSVANISPAAVIVRDSLHDLIAGCVRGGIVYLKAMRRKDSLPQQPPVSLHIYPNPAFSFLTITAAASIREIHAITLDGRDIFLPFDAIPTGAITDISALAQGIYFLRIVTEKETCDTILVKIE